MFRISSLARNASFALILLMSASTLLAAGKAPVPAINWQEGSPGCTFERSDDGKYRYGLWNGDVGVILAVDSQELQKLHRRIEQKMLGISLTIRYRGKGSLDFKPDHISLEFVSHYHVIHETLDPDDLATALQSKADSFSDETQHEISRHPEKKDEKEAALQNYQKDLTEMLEFLSTRSLKATRLDQGTSEASGWLFFSTSSKWIGDWKKREDFVLRVPLNDQLFVIPFSLPPAEGDLILRKR